MPDLTHIWLLITFLSAFNYLQFQWYYFCLHKLHMTNSNKWQTALKTLGWYYISDILFDTKTPTIISHLSSQNNGNLLTWQMMSFQLKLSLNISVFTIFPIFLIISIRVSQYLTIYQICFLGDFLGCFLLHLLVSHY